MGFTNSCRSVSVTRIEGRKRVDIEKEERETASYGSWLDFLVEGVILLNKKFSVILYLYRSIASWRHNTCGYSL